MNIDYMETEPSYYVTKDYGIGNETLKIEHLTEVYVVCYTIKKKGSNEPEEIYTFTTLFEQALKRFKLLPHTKCLLKRVLTDNEELIKLAQDGTKETVVFDEDASQVSLDETTMETLKQFRDDPEEGSSSLQTGIKVTEVDHKTMAALNLDELLG